MSRTTILAVTGEKATVTEAPAPTTPAPPTPAQDAAAMAVQWAFALVLLVAALEGARRLRVFRRRSVLGPPRVPPGRPVWPLLFAAFAGFVVWVVAQSLFVASRMDQLQGDVTTAPAAPTSPSPSARVDLSKLTATDMAFLATVPGALAFGALLLAGTAVRGSVGQRLGLSLRQFIPGCAKGAITFLIALPIVYTVMVAADTLYRVFDYQHPPEHTLLRVLSADEGAFVKYLAIAGAAVVAPLFEELLFRGYLQTVIRTGLERLAHARSTTPALTTQGFPVVVEPPQPGAPLASLAPVPARPAPTWPAWVAVLASATVFTVQHDRWTWPPIFALAVCLGYVYERTANLWAAVLLHVLFNATMTGLYLWSRQVALT